MAKACISRQCHSQEQASSQHQAVTLDNYLVHISPTMFIFLFKYWLDRELPMCSSFSKYDKRQILQTKVLNHFNFFRVVVGWYFDEALGLGNTTQCKSDWHSGCCYIHKKEFLVMWTLPLRTSVLSRMGVYRKNIILMLLPCYMFLVIHKYLCKFLCKGFNFCLVNSVHEMYLFVAPAVLFPEALVLIPWTTSTNSFVKKVLVVFFLVISVLLDHFYFQCDNFSKMYFCTLETCFIHM